MTGFTFPSPQTRHPAPDTRFLTPQLETLPLLCYISSLEFTNNQQTCVAQWLRSNERNPLWEAMTIGETAVTAFLLV